MEDVTLKTGQISENGQIEIIDQDRLCFKVASRSKGAYGIRTISKDLLNEFLKLYIEKPNITANEARELLSGQSEIDKFEYGYASTLWQMAKMSDANPTKNSISQPAKKQIPGTPTAISPRRAAARNRNRPRWLRNPDRYTRCTTQP